MLIDSGKAEGTPDVIGNVSVIVGNAGKIPSFRDRKMILLNSRALSPVLPSPGGREGVHPKTGHHLPEHTVKEPQACFSLHARL
jgi:hypothetical protein